MPNQFFEPLIETDPDALKQIGVERIREDFPTWTPAKGGLVDATLGANAVITAEERDIATVVPRALVRTIGTELHRFNPIDATTAEADVTIYATDTLGHELDANTQFTIKGTGDTAYGFENPDPIVILPGTNSVPAALTALQEGAASSGLSGEVKPVLSYAWVDHIALSGVTFGGVDAEDDDVFLNRFVRWLATLVSRPVLAADVPAFAQRTPGVFRVYVLDNYNTADGTTTNEKMISVFPIDEAGANVSSGVKTALHDDLHSNREGNMIWNIADPTRTDIKVGYDVALAPGYDAVAVKADIDAAITGFFNPGLWGSVPEGEVAGWDINATVVRRTALVTLVSLVPGADYIRRPAGVTALTLAAGTDALSGSDVVLPGPAPLPHLTSITGTVS